MAQAPAVPLTLASESASVSVSRVKGTPEVKQHLSTLGFVEGAQVDIVSRIHGDVIVLVKGARLGLNRQMASHIYVTA